MVWTMAVGMVGKWLRGIFGHAEDWEQLVTQFAVFFCDLPELGFGSLDSMVPNIDGLDDA